MTDQPVAEAFADHEAFVERPPGFSVETAALENRVTVGDGAVEVRVDLPSLETVVVDASVPPVVVDGWFDTLARRLRGGFDVTHAEGRGPPEVVRTAGTVTVTYRLGVERPARAAADAKALVDFAVGTYVQGAIPGYEYDSPLRELLSSAWERGGAGRT